MVMSSIGGGKVTPTVFGKTCEGIRQRLRSSAAERTIELPAFIDTATKFIEQLQAIKAGVGKSRPSALLRSTSAGGATGFAQGNLPLSPSAAAAAARSPKPLPQVSEDAPPPPPEEEEEEEEDQVDLDNLPHHRQLSPPTQHLALPAAIRYTSGVSLAAPSSSDSGRSYMLRGHEASVSAMDVHLSAMSSADDDDRTNLRRADSHQPVKSNEEKWGEEQVRK